ncbi:SDR family NAD(P)-dependent oxidoreductase [Streptomyces sp. DSM 44915]|uniref:SDR family NAD(P)-dependent oxidoreductase n=1 Tax=Streptomyces chisholmiae TaxID=3075540 RepID=A0ABU2JRG6_9ACTN|nr:SDR family NAD(P)-dependent oxidoreductase [Streptomyces sp. DSM 44915]MDT0267351.1 SDR family NAD(P)-dependent oxidoreductase [Streptomyces sp. DSM 44915]
MSSRSAESAHGAPIAVVGLACRLPGGANPDEFWRLLSAGGDAVAEPPPGRWPAGAPRRGGFLPAIDGFDAGFFGISPREAAVLDPQARLVLELAWESLEHARVAPTALRDSDTGVYLGAIANDWEHLAGPPGPHTFTGTQRGLLANRVSYHLGLRGPSLTLDTGQSSSLVSVHTACQDLRAGTVRTALAGGVNLIAGARSGAVLDAFGALSPDGRCHTFDRRANGYARGEGGVLLVLRPLADAVADGDRVHAVILGGAVNNDGGGEGLTVPHGPAQAAVIRRACRDAGVRAADVSYVELHGTGTRAGDPVEAAALGAALGEERRSAGPLLVGSVKTNIGHLEGAAGAAGLLKVVLGLREGTLPPSLHFTEPPADIPLDELNLAVVTEPRAWPRGAGRRIAGVSSFGVGGTNCHLVVAEPPATAPAGGRPAVAEAPALPLSARSAAALRAQAGALAERLAADRAPDPRDVAHTLRHGRAALERRAVVLDGTPAGLAALAAGRPADGVVVGTAVPGATALVFPGQGTQWAGMARELLAGPPAVADRLAACADALAPFVDYAPLDVLRGAPDAPSLERVDVVQPALWAVMVSLAELWRSVGVAPETVIGHSQGEIAAATVAGALSLDDGARVVALRSRALRALDGGGMLSVGAPVAVLEELLPGAPEVGVAAVNGPRSVVVSGPRAALDALAATLAEAGHRVKSLPVGYASHSPAVAAIRAELAELLAPVRPVATEVTFLSTLTGGPLDTARLDADYWYENLRHEVRFGAATEAALGRGVTRFVEVSPHPVLLGGIAETAERAGVEVATVGTLRRDEGGAARWAACRAEAWVAGLPVRWPAVPDGRPVDLPTYPFQRQRHWVGEAPVAEAAGRRAPGATPRQARTLVAEAVAGVLGHTDPNAVEQGRAFRDLGFDSALTSELHRRLEYLTDLRLPSSLLFDFPTPRRAAEHLRTLLAAHAARRDATPPSARAASAAGLTHGAGAVPLNEAPAAGATPASALGAGAAGRARARSADAAGNTVRGAGAAGEVGAGQGAETTGAARAASAAGLTHGAGAPATGGGADAGQSPTQGAESTGAAAGQGPDASAASPAATRGAGTSPAAASAFGAGATGRTPATVGGVTGTSPDAAAAPAQAQAQGGTSDAAPAAGPAAAAGEPIAIVGMGCRLPSGIDSPEGFWELLAKGRETLSELPGNRGWDLAALHGGACATRQGSFLHEADAFDPEFFGLSPREALAMDPQQRLMLEICWEAVERAGLDPTGLADSATGVFVGAMAGDYGPRLHQPTGAADGHLLTGTTLSVVSGRIAYTLGLRGPALTVDTACSSSLVAVQLATAALRRGECSLALAGGVAVMANPGHLVEFSRQNGLAPDGRAKAFDESADGTSFAEGAGVLLLERLSDARRNGHRVLAVIRGVAVNSDGASNGLSAPNGQAQGRVIRDALADAGLAPADVAAIEAHGTGTALGDPVEAHALLATYGQDREAPAWLGSVKSNVGHTQAAAGVVGVIKMVLALRHRLLPRTLHVARPSGRVRWSDGAVRLLTEPRPWPAGAGPRRAAVSSFGISGTNAHLVLEEAPPAAEVAGAPAGPLVWVLSARSAAALRAQAGRLLPLAEHAEPADVAPLLARRASFAHRAVVVAADRAELVAALGALAAGEAHSALLVAVAPAETRPVLVFPGQGAQWVGMATELLDQDPEFAADVARCGAALAPHTGWSVTEVLRGAPGAPSLDATDVVQPVLFALMYALAGRWRAAGVEPAAVVGHSQGEIAAAAVAGALSLAEAARISALRAQVVGSLDGTGGVLAVGLPVAEVEARLAPWADRLWVAVDNGPVGCVVAGELAAMEEFAADCGDRVQLRRAPVAYAAHTPHVTAVREELLDRLGALTPRDTEVTIGSALTGTLVDGSRLDPGYWYRNLAERVRFDAAVRAVAADGPGAPLFVEVSPHPILTNAVAEILDDAGVAGAAVGTLRRGEGGRHRLLTALAAAWTRGAPVDWPALLGPVRAELELPGYPFERRRFWLHASRHAGHPLVADVLPLAEGAGLLLTGRVSLAGAPWLADHAVDGRVLLPGTAFVELALRAAAEAGAPGVETLTLHQPLELPADGAVALQVQVVDGALTVHARVGDDGPWTRHASGALSTAPAAAPGPLAQWPPADATPVEVAEAYAGLTARGYGYGPAFRGLTAAWRDADGWWGEIAAPVTGAEACAVHPALLDAALHPLLLAAEGLLLPFAVSGVRVVRAGVERLRVRVRGGEVVLYDERGAVVAWIEDAVLRPPAAGAAEWYRMSWADAGPAPVPGAADAAPLVLPFGAELPDGVPPLVVVGRPDGPAGEAAGWAAATVRRWVTEERFGDARLVFTADPDAPAGSAVWGLVRSAMAEHPGRFGLADAPAELAGAGPADQFRVRDGRTELPRLVRGALAGEAAGVDLTDGTVLVTGGTGGLGALVARHLVARHGVVELLLVSRRGPAAPGAAELTAELTALGASVTVAACDVGDRAALAAVLSGRRLVGVVHAAGELADGTVAELTPERLAAAQRPKAEAAELLDELTAEAPLRAFVLFSSVAGVLGNPGQAAYAAANARLDGLARRRRAAGRPAVSVAWGLWELPTGMTGRLSGADRRRLAALVPLTEREGLALFDTALRADAEPTLVASRFDRRVLRALGGELPEVLRGLAPAPRRDAEPAAGAAEPAAGRPRFADAEAVTAFVRERVAEALGHASGATVDPDRPFSELGLDSLTSVELRNRISAATGLRLPASLVFNHPTVTLLGRHLAERLAPDPAAELAEALARTLPALPAERAVALLTEALAGLGAPVRTGPPRPVAPPPPTTSDEELFAFIDSQL